MIPTKKNKLTEIRSLFNNARKVRNVYGENLLAQALEVLRLRYGPGKLGASEYYFYNLYNNREYTAIDKRRFVGWRMQEHIDYTTPKEWWAIVEDKLLLYGYLEGLDFPVPRHFAIYHPFRTFGKIPCVRTDTEIEQLIAKQINYPFFGKPNAGGRGLGTISALSYDKENQTILMADGTKLPLNEQVNCITQYNEGGYLFQETLTPHPLLVEICGNNISTVRIIIIITKTGPKILAAAWRIPAANNFVDNFSQPGNLLGGVDVSNGRIQRVISGTGLEQKKLTTHPDTGYHFSDITLPGWSTIEDLVLSSASTLPGVKVQAWDIAMCASGPVILEANIGGDIDVPQVGNARGLLTNELAELLGSDR